MHRTRINLFHAFASTVLHKFAGRAMTTSAVRSDYAQTAAARNPFDRYDRGKSLHDRRSMRQAALTGGHFHKFNFPLKIHRESEPRELTKQQNGK